MEIKDSLKLKLDDWIELTKSGTKIPVVTMLNGNSMYPLIKKNRDIVTIIPTPDEIKVGQIAVFRINNDTCVAHRIYKINGDSVITLGDNCNKPDLPISRAQIVGIIQYVQKSNKKYNLNCKSQIIYGKIWMSFLRYFWIFYKTSRRKINSLLHKNQDRA